MDSDVGFEGWIWMLIASVPDLGILFTLMLSIQLLDTWTIYSISIIFISNRYHCIDRTADHTVLETDHSTQDGGQQN